MSDQKYGSFDLTFNVDIQIYLVLTYDKKITTLHILQLYEDKIFNFFLKINSLNFPTGQIGTV